MASLDATPKQSASLDGLKEKTTANAAAPVTVKGDVVDHTPNLEYERYLELHHQFDGSAKKKFMRKCELQIYRIRLHVARSHMILTGA